jgi:hypothetical protein
MIDKRLAAAAGGFAFVAAWIGFGFGDALLCLLGAAVAWLAVAIADGELDLGEMQRRLRGEDAPPKAPPAAAGPSPRRSGRPRVE